MGGQILKTGTNHTSHVMVPVYAKALLLHQSLSMTLVKFTSGHITRPSLGDNDISLCSSPVVRTNGQIILFAYAER